MKFGFVWDFVVLGFRILLVVLVVFVILVVFLSTVTVRPTSSDLNHRKIRAIAPHPTNLHNQLSKTTNQIITVCATMNDIRLALKFAYDGTRFHGSQRQTNQSVRTVEGELISALQAIGAIETPQTALFQVASRTDRGVSALGNVFTLNTNAPENELLTALNAALDDCWVYGFAKVAPDFKPRYARERWYRYYIPQNDLNYEKISEAAKIFMGEHNFRNYANRGVENPVREIRDIQVNEEEDHFILDLRAESFIWNQIRRIVKALELVGIGKKQLAEVKYALEHPEDDIDFRVATAENLILMDIIYDFEFEIDNTLFTDIKQKLETQIYSII